MRLRDRCARRLVNRLDGEHVLKPFFARRFRLSVTANAICKMFCLQHELEWKLAGAELVDLLTTDLSVQMDAVVVERRFHYEIALLAVDIHETRSALAIRAAARRDDTRRELHRP